METESVEKTSRRTAQGKAPVEIAHQRRQRACGEDCDANQGSSLESERGSGATLAAGPMLPSVFLMEPAATIPSGASPEKKSARRKT